MTDVTLTPTQDLIMEVLSARDRLGAQIWTFHKRHLRPLKDLASWGLVECVESDIVPDRIRCSITDAGRHLYQVSPYGPQEGQQRSIHTDSVVQLINDNVMLLRENMALLDTITSKTGDIHA